VNFFITLLAVTIGLNASGLEVKSGYVLANVESFDSQTVTVTSLKEHKKIKVSRADILSPSKDLKVGQEIKINLAAVKK
jgi:hypothetical protein